jgi:hypothetical protein
MTLGEMAMTIQDAVARGLVAAKVYGAGPGVTSSVKVSLQPSGDSPQALDITFPRGTTFVPWIPIFQLHPVTEDTTVQVPIGKVTWADVPTICGDSYGKQPAPVDGSVPYDIGFSPFFDSLFSSVDLMNHVYIRIANDLGMPPAIPNATIPQWATWQLFEDPPFVPIFDPATGLLTCLFCKIPVIQGDRTCEGCGAPFNWTTFSGGVRVEAGDTDGSDPDPLIEAWASGAPAGDSPTTETTQGGRDQGGTAQPDGETGHYDDGHTFGWNTTVDILNGQIGGRVPPDTVKTIAGCLWDGVVLTNKVFKDSVDALTTAAQDAVDPDHAHTYSPPPKPGENVQPMTPDQSIPPPGADTSSFQSDADVRKAWSSTAYERLLDESTSAVRVRLDRLAVAATGPRRRARRTPNKGLQELYDKLEQVNGMISALEGDPTATVENNSAFFANLEAAYGDISFGSGSNNKDRAYRLRDDVYKLIALYQGKGGAHAVNEAIYQQKLDQLVQTVTIEVDMGGGLAGGELVGHATKFAETQTASSGRTGFESFSTREKEGTTPVREGSAPTSEPSKAPAEPQKGPSEGTWDNPEMRPTSEQDAVKKYNDYMQAEQVGEAAKNFKEQYDLAVEAGVPGIEEKAVGFNPNDKAINNQMKAHDVMEARLNHEGYDTHMAPEAFNQVQEQYTRSQSEGLSRQDITDIQGKVNANPNYFEDLPKQGHITDMTAKPWNLGGQMPQEGFISALDAGSAGQLKQAFINGGGHVP